MFKTRNCQGVHSGRQFGFIAVMLWLLFGAGLAPNAQAAATIQYTAAEWIAYGNGDGFNFVSNQLYDSGPCFRMATMTPEPVEQCQDKWAATLLPLAPDVVTGAGWKVGDRCGFNCMEEIFCDSTSWCSSGGKMTVSQLSCPVGQFDWNNPLLARCVSISVPPPKNAGQPCPCQSAGDPINVGAGNKFEVVTDYKGGGAFPLNFVRSYNSINSANFGPLGFGWSDNQHLYLTINSCVSTQAGDCGSSTITIQRPDGKAYTFTAVNLVVNGSPIAATAQGTVWQGDSDVAGIFVTSAVSGTGTATADTQFSFTDTGGSVELYNGSGQIQSITRPGGLTHTFAYDSSGNLIRVSDGFGHSLSFSYSPDNTLWQMTDPAGRIYTYRYDNNFNLADVWYTNFSSANRVMYLYKDSHNPNLLTGIVDQNGVNYASWTYDSLGNAVSSKNAGGIESVTISYNQDGSANVTEASGQVRHFTFNTINGVAKLANVSAPCPACADTGQSVTYDSAGYMSSKTDFNGNQTNYIVDDGTGLEVSRTEAVGTQAQRTITTQWDTTLRQPTLITEPGRTTAYTHDSAGHVLTSVVTDTATNVSRTTTYTYNSAGLLATTTDPMGHVTSYSYDAGGDLSSISNALGQVIQITQYDANGYPLTIVDPNGTTNSLVYDSHERLISKTIGGATTQYAYDPVNDLVQVTLPTGSYLAYSYDSARRLTGISDNLGNSISFTLDNLGNRIQEQTFDPNSVLTKTLQRSYNDLNQLITEVGGAGQVTQVSYDLLGNPTLSTDPMSNQTHQNFDALNRLSSVIDPSGGSVGYAYDPLGRVQDVTDPRGLDTHYTYDGFGDVTTQQSPDTGKTTYTYDLDGNRLTKTDAKGVTAIYSYDSLNRLTGVSYADTTKNVTHTYDQGANGIGRLTGTTDASGSTNYQYDPRGNLTQKTSVVEGHTFTVAYQYDLGNNLIGITYPNGMQVAYRRDGVDRISGVSATVNGTTQALISSVAYEPFGPITSLIYGNGLAETRTYDQDYRLTSISVPAVVAWGYTDNLDDDITSIGDGLVSANSQTLGYDSLNRLTSAQGAYGTQGYVYDSDGNRTQETLSGVSTTLTYDSASNKLLTAGAKTDSYDLDGSLTSDGSHTYAYDATERLSGYDKATNAYLYNGLGQRVRKSLPVTVIPGDANGDGIIDQNDLLALHAALKGQIPITPGMDCNQDGVVDMKDNSCIAQKIGQYKNQGKNVSASVTVTTSSSNSLYFVYDEAGHLLGEFDQSGNAVAEHIWLGDRPIAVTAGTGFNFVITDQLATPRVITNSAGTAVWTWNSDPFGNGQPTGSFTYNLRHPGQYYDAETGHVYNYYRDYDSSTGRYIESDPIGLNGGFDTYAYVSDDPSNVVDASGLLGWNVSQQMTAEDVETGQKYAAVPGYAAHTIQPDDAAITVFSAIDVVSDCRCNGDGSFSFIGYNVTIKIRAHVRGGLPATEESWLKRAEGDHIQDGMTWANGDGRNIAQGAEEAFAGSVYGSLEDCQTRTYPSELQQTLRAAADAEAKQSALKWDKPGLHDFGNPNRRP